VYFFIQEKPEKLFEVSTQGGHSAFPCPPQAGAW